MSELINKQNHRNFRWQLLATVSALSLTLAVSAHASESDKPTVWIELGGQLERITGLEDPFLPPFALQSPTPRPFLESSPAEAQKPSIYSYGAEGALSFRPHESDWVFTAAIRYGRSNNNKDIHQQSMTTEVFQRHFNTRLLGRYATLREPLFADYNVRNSESHAILDFQAGRDIGIGGFKSNVGFGVRSVDFVSKSHIGMIVRPDITFYSSIYKFGNPAHPRYLDVFGKIHTDYMASADSSRSFRGLGPSVSWNGDVAMIGNEDGALTVDWGINASLLFGRQKAQGAHGTSARLYHGSATGTPAPGVSTVYNHPPRIHDRSRSVVVPNVGVLAGFSFRYPNAKVSFGYRADMFFGAMDMGIDQRDVKDRTFHGPFASVSIGLGG
jgi:hypothetical protein